MQARISTWLPKLASLFLMTMLLVTFTLCGRRAGSAAATSGIQGTTTFISALDAVVPIGSSGSGLPFAAEPGAPILFDTIIPVGIPSSPLADVSIVVRPAGGGSVIAHTVTDAQGKYRLALAPGNYEVTATPAGGVLQPQSQDATVTSGLFTVVNFQFIIGPTLLP